MISYLCVTLLGGAFLTLYLFRSSTPWRRYRHPPLPEQSIRLLTLHPGPFHARIRCDISSTPLELAEGYEALSYVWGDPKAVISILLCGRTFNVTPNLFDALCHLRHETWSRKLWIDAVCINQRDDTEKKQQVLLMPKIYGHASKVLVWLGRAAPETGRVFEELRQWKSEESEEDSKIVAYMTHIWTPQEKNSSAGNASLAQILTNSDRPSTDRPVEYSHEGPVHKTSLEKVPKRLPLQENSCEDEARSSKEVVKGSESIFLKESPEPSEQTTKCLVDLLSERVWWTRLWVIQEIAFANDIDIVCGKYSIPWSMNQIIMKRFMGQQKAKFSRLLTSALQPSFDIQRTRASRSGEWGNWVTEREDLLTLLFTFAGKACTDPKDRIFALLNLLYSRPIPLQPNYALSISEVFTAATRAMMRQTMTLDAICNSTNAERSVERRDRPRDLYVPSWVPDWTSGFGTDPLLLHNGVGHAFWAEENSRVAEDFDGEQPWILKLQGYDLDEIFSVTAPANGHVRELGLLRRIWAKYPPDNGGSYIVNGEHCLQSLWRTLVKNTMRRGGSRWGLRAEDVSKFHPLFIDFCEYLFQDNDDHDLNVRKAILDSQQHMPEDDNPNILWRQVLWKNINESWFGWTFCLSSMGFYVLVDGDVRPGDRIFFLDGASVPLILRYVGDQCQGRSAPENCIGFWEKVGTAYVHGLMYGGIDHVAKNGSLGVQRKTIALV